MNEKRTKLLLLFGKRKDSLALLLSSLLWPLLLWSGVETQLQTSPSTQLSPSTYSHTTATLSQPRAHPSAISSGEFVFFAGGILSVSVSQGMFEATDRVDILNVMSGVWTTATLSMARALIATATLRDLVFFAGGGRTSLEANGTTDRIDIYNISSGSWSTATLSQPRYGLAATSVGDLVLFGGGTPGEVENESNVIDVYNVSSNTWTTATLSQARVGLGATSVANRFALFAGGSLGMRNHSNVIDIFDYWSGNWSTTTLPRIRGNLAAVTVANLVFFAGTNATNQTLDFTKLSNFQNQTALIDIFDLSTQNWSTATLSPPRALLGIASVGNIVVFGGGTSDGLSASTIVNVYDVRSDTWFTSNLSEARAALAATSSGNKIFFGGGLSNTGLSDVVDIFEFYPTPLSPTLPSSTNSTGSSN
jgi:hypothetical protein